jgi:hypothetical protein
MILLKHILKQHIKEVKNVITKNKQGIAQEINLTEAFFDPDRTAKDMGLVSKPGRGLWGPPGWNEPATHKTFKGAIVKLKEPISREELEKRERELDQKEAERKKEKEDARRRKRLGLPPVDVATQAVENAPRQQPVGKMPERTPEQAESLRKKFEEAAAGLPPYIPRTEEQEKRRMESMVGPVPTPDPTRDKLPVGRLMTPEEHAARAKMLQENSRILDENPELAAIVIDRTNKTGTYSDERKNDDFIHSLRTVGTKVILSLENGEMLNDMGAFVTAITSALGRTTIPEIKEFTPEYEIQMGIPFGTLYGLYLRNNRDEGKPDAFSARALDVAGIPIHEYTDKQVSALSTFVHETVHAVRYDSYRALMLQGTKAGYVLDEGITEYVTGGIMAAILTPEQYEQYRPSTNTHPYDPYRRGVSLLVEYGDFDVADYFNNDDYKMQEGISSYTWNTKRYEYPSTRPVYDVVQKARAAQGLAMKNLIEKEARRVDMSDKDIEFWVNKFDNAFYRVWKEKSELAIGRQVFTNGLVWLSAGGVSTDVKSLNRFFTNLLNDLEANLTYAPPGVEYRSRLEPFGPRSASNTND